MKAFKFLAEGSVGRFSDAAWPRPAGGAPGAWVEAAGPVEECRSGVHACNREHLLDWIDDELWEIELDRVEHDDGARLVAGRGRLLRRVDEWNVRTAVVFAAACAGRARAHAVVGLRDDGYLDAARSLAAARSLHAVNAVAAAATDARSAEAAGFAADCMLLAQGARPDESEPRRGPIPSAAAIAANLAFVSAHAAGRARAPYDDDAYAETFARERAWQLRFLSRVLALPR